jgi:hypothetical protein
LNYTSIKLKSKATYMRKIKLCEHCGSGYEIDDADEDLGVCDECEPTDEDMIGIVDFSEWSED